MKRFIMAAVLLGMFFGGCATARAAITPAEAKQIAIQAYIYGYPLVTMEMTRRVMTNVREPEGTRAPWVSS